MTVIHIILMDHYVSQHSIWSTPHNSGTYYVRRDVGQPPDAQIKL